MKTRGFSLYFSLWFVLQSTIGAFAGTDFVASTPFVEKLKASYLVAQNNAKPEEAGSENSQQSSADMESAQACTTEMLVNGTIGPATHDALERNIEVSREWGCKSVLLLMNTPGGSLPSTRKIVTTILNSPLPVLCLIYPSGAHAGSAGAIIMQACHVSGAMVATNVGAATPVSGSQKEIPKDLRKKLINDTVSWMEGVTKLRDRNLKFSRQIITDAKAVSAKEAVRLGAIDFLAETKQSFLDYAQGRTVKLSEATTTVVQVGEIKFIPPDVRERVLKFVADPQTAYLIFMGSLALLYFEITHPGTIVPGVIGAIGLVFAMISLDKMDVTWGGVALILLGIGFLIAEAFVASFGILGIGGTISFIVGSVLLFDESKTGYSIPTHVIVTVSISLGTIAMMIAYAAFKTRNVRRRGGFDDMIGEVANISQVNSSSARKGKMSVHGELWNVKSSSDLSEGQSVKITGTKGLTLLVEPTNEES